MKEKYQLSFFFDYGTETCLWCRNQKAYDKFSVHIDLDKLPLSEKTKAKIYELDDMFYDSLNWESPADPGPWRQDMCEKFNFSARELYEQIAQELGDEFEVFYDFNDLKEDPDLEAYLKNPQEFRRK